MRLCPPHHVASEAAPELSPSRSAAADENVQEQVWGFQKNPIAAAQPSWRAFDPGANPECEGGCAMQSGFDPRKINFVETMGVKETLQTLSWILHCINGPLEANLHVPVFTSFYFPENVLL